MNIFWSVVLLISTVLAIASVYFFGHSLVSHEGPWKLASAACLIAAVALFFVQVKFRHDNHHHTHH